MNILLFCFSVGFTFIAVFVVVPIATVITATRWCFSIIKKLHSRIFNRAG